MGRRLMTPEERLVSEKRRGAKERRREIARERLGGKTLAQVGRERGVSRQRVHQVMNSDEAREVVRREQLRLVGSVPRAVENLMGLVEGFGKASRERMKMGYDASKEVLRTAGMLPVPSNSQTTITQIFQQANIVASPVVQRFLEEQTRKLRWEGDGEDVVEGEVKEDAG